MRTTNRYLIALAAVALASTISCKEDDANDDAAGTAEETADSAADSTGGGAFVFATDPPTAYTRVDRSGMPAVNTAVIPMGRKDEYNANDPADDVGGIFVDDITASVTAVHDILDVAIMGAGLTPCAPADCLAAAAPLVVPDTIKIDPSMAAGFPNGRQPQDQVIDVTLAVLLLDLTVHTALDLAALPLNPEANDKDFLAEFPYFAEPHTL
jgi:hypothetical protein